MSKPTRKNGRDFVHCLKRVLGIHKLHIFFAIISLSLSFATSLFSHNPAYGQDNTGVEVDLNVLDQYRSPSASPNQRNLIPLPAYTNNQMNERMRQYKEALEKRARAQRKQSDIANQQKPKLKAQSEAFLQYPRAVNAVPNLRTRPLSPERVTEPILHPSEYRKGIAFKETPLPQTKPSKLKKAAYKLSAASGNPQSPTAKATNNAKIASQGKAPIPNAKPKIPHNIVLASTAPSVIKAQTIQNQNKAHNSTQKNKQIDKELLALPKEPIELAALAPAAAHDNSLTIRAAPSLSVAPLVSTMDLTEKVIERATTDKIKKEPQTSKKHETKTIRPPLAKKTADKKLEPKKKTEDGDIVSGPKSMPDLPVEKVETQDDKDKESFVAENGALLKRHQVLQDAKTNTAKSEEKEEINLTAVTPAPTDIATIDGGITKVTLPYDESGTDLDMAAMAAIKRDIIDVVPSIPDARIQIQSFASTTDQGLNSDRRISLSRALAMRAFLMDQGIKPNQIDVRALGDETSQSPVDRIDIYMITSGKTL